MIELWSRAQIFYNDTKKKFLNLGIKQNSYYISWKFRWEVSLFSDTNWYWLCVVTDKHAYQEKIEFSNLGMAASINVRARSHVRKIWRNQELGFPWMHSQLKSKGLLWRQIHTEGQFPHLFLIFFPLTGVKLPILYTCNA